ncbi:glycoside hydrolase family 2 protein [Lachnoclostridium sp. An169]|uniref:glycoside hydrolase family 2 protein n=1 Tax=Lachnoclostridium sp. An169 TaxID=1965569 RepID=UPI001FA81DAC|nr:glycoside hydrolase family 2 protein [Lachnoclostridium sp. An169]
MEKKELRKSIKLNQGWRFTGPSGREEAVNLPHTWNAKDGQDGGNDYYRGTCHYRTEFAEPEFDREREVVYLEFRGVNATADVELNGQKVMHHDGGYSTFRKDITEFLEKENEIRVAVDNSVNDRVYPQKADFTFYGGIYRDVYLRIVPKDHFDLDYYGGEGVRITPRVKGKDAVVRVESCCKVPDARIKVTILDACGRTAAESEGADAEAVITNVHLWDGVKDPYMYTALVRLLKDGAAVDEVSVPFGVRTFSVDPKKGFFLNGRPYPLHGVSRHQDRKGIGNALTERQHEEDMEMIREIGANTIRLAHYQHDQYFYDLCDRYGMIVWAEIPYISEHMPNGRENTISQMKELIVQNYNHPSIVTWGISNEITISTKDKKDMMENHRELNDLCHSMDPGRPTTLACYAMCGPFNPVAHVTDLVSWNLYLGWYVPGLFLNDWWISFFHKVYPNRCLGFSEYGCEGMPNLHSSTPHRGDHTEEYQCIYHEFMLKCFERHPYMWSTHVWNMFDFAADARDQGGEPGMNHKGLVTFDRKIKKDSFYIYKAYWSDEPFVHLCGKRYVNRAESETTIKVYSNCREIELYQNGRLLEKKTGEKVFEFRVKLEAENEIRVVSGEYSDTMTVRKVAAPDPAYQLPKKKGKSANWV